MHYNRQKDSTIISRYDETIVSSNLNFGNSLTLNSMNDAQFKAAKIKAGGDLDINVANNLSIEAASETHRSSTEVRNKGNYFFKNGDYGYYNVDIINTEISSNNQSNSGLNFNVGNAIIASYKVDTDNLASQENLKTGLNNSTYSQDFSNDPNLAYLNLLNEDQTLYNPIEEISKTWNETTRGLTKAGTAVVAITATALTAGAMGPVGGSIGKGALVGAASATASTASVAAVNASLNADGDIFKQLKTVGKDTWDATTSKESIKNIVISAAAAGLATAASNYINTGSLTATKDVANATNSANAANTLNTGSLGANSPNFTTRLTTNFTNSLKSISINTLSSTAAQSTITGESFTNNLQNQLTNAIIYSLSKAVANEIGRAYHGSTIIDANGNTLGQTEGIIDKPTQLLLHGILGASTAKLTNTDLTSGALSGVVGELSAEGVNKLGLNQQSSIDFANLMGAISAVAYGNLSNQEDSDIANSAWEGSRIASNAAENNFFFAPLLVYTAEELALIVGTAIAAAYGAKNTADILKNSNSSSSSSQGTSSQSAAVSGGGAPDPDWDPEDPEGNNFKEIDKKYSKHQNEFGNITKEQYKDKAYNLASSKSDGNILSHSRYNGDVIKYNRSTNEFVSISRDGNIRTFFRPSKGIEYWKQQIK